MHIAIASGKGGTGKTTVAVALALALSRDRQVTLVDADVEEPNDAFFLSLAGYEEKKAFVPAFSVVEHRCSGCGRCARSCRFNAVAFVGGKPLFFPELCHGCGGCLRACPVNAIDESTREHGVIFQAYRKNMSFIGARLHVGEAMAVPLIRTVKAQAPQSDVTVVDCPPGNACPMIAAIHQADAVLLVAEATPFGLHDLSLAVMTMRSAGMPFSVIVNRQGCGDDRVREYCIKEKIPVIGTITDNKTVAELYAAGQTPYGNDPGFTDEIETIAAAIRTENIPCANS